VKGKRKANIQWLLYCMAHNTREMYTGDTGGKRGDKEEGLGKRTGATGSPGNKSAIKL
jgi:hypothetical protein